MKRLAGLTLLLLLLAVALPAAATQCETFTNHSGFVPDGWTATFTEDGTDYGPYEGPAFVDPGTAYEGNRTWDRAVKCRTVESTTTTTPTTVPSSTTTTAPPPENSTTTLAVSTTTTQPGSTSTQPSTTSSTLPAISSTVPTPSTTGPSNPDQAVLPFTGVADVWLVVGALTLLAGVGVLTVTRRED